MKLVLKRFLALASLPALVLFSNACSSEGSIGSSGSSESFESNRDLNEEPGGGDVEPVHHRNPRVPPPAPTTALPPATGPVPPPPSGTPTPGTQAPVRVHLVPQSPSSAAQRVNFAIPLSAASAVTDPVALRVRAGGVDVAATTRTLARHPSGAVRSVQVQFDLALAGERDVDVEFGAAGPIGPALVPVTDTLVNLSGDAGPRVWAVLPASVLSASGVVGLSVPAANVPSGPMSKWQSVCDYGASKYSTATFLSQNTERAVWLYDRGTVFYRGYAASGALGALKSAYVETSLYRATSTGTGAAFRIGVPGASTDLKYHYAQNLALHYLLSGDDRFREAAENVATRAAALWSPSYDGSSSDFWTERNAGFLLLAQVWASMVSDDRAAAFRTAADATFDAALAVQNSFPSAYNDASARCFAHHGDAHDAAEGNSYFGCSPWMSAILADGIDAYSRETSATRRASASQSLVKLGRILARDSADPGSLRPYYWMGVGTSQDAPDDYDEHRGEVAYVIAMAWHHSGRTDAALRTAADKFVSAFSSSGTVGQLRSFNWQCRSAVATPAFLLP